MAWLSRLFSDSPDDSPVETTTHTEISEIQDALQSVDENRIPYVACLALLGARVAGADSEISDGEKNRMIDVLKEDTHLSQDEAVAAVDIATSKELAHSIEHQRVTSLTNEFATLEQKISIIRALFHIACDDDISEVENEKIRAISKALLLSNNQYIQLRSEFREFRSLLKK